MSDETNKRVAFVLLGAEICSRCSAPVPSEDSVKPRWLRICSTCRTTNQITMMMEQRPVYPSVSEHLLASVNGGSDFEASIFNRKALAKFGDCE